MSATGRAPNMADVAKRAGVSHQTVWRVLNDSPLVRETTRARVQAAIAELGYRRNLSARHLATSRSMVIGVLGPASANFGPTSSMYAVEHAVRAAGYHPLLMSAEPDESHSALDRLLDQSAEALVVIAPYRSTVHAIEELNARVPIVVLQAGARAAGSSVAVDQAAGVRAAVDHLVELGHERIQHIAGPADFSDARLRADAFAAQLRRWHLPALPVLSGDWTPESGYLAARRLHETATALFCGNDQMALGAIHALAERGITVPGDVSVLGFDDIPESAHTLPPLTTVHQDFAAVGRLSLQKLLAKVEENDQTTDKTIVPTRLVVRASTGPRR